MKSTRKKIHYIKNKTFSKKDYNSNDGMLTTIWGPGIWHFLHTMSFNYPIDPTVSEKKHYRDFILNLEYILPCGKCRKNLHNNLRKFPITMNWMKSRDTFSLYVYKLHEIVNQMLKKNSGLSYEQVRERYEHFRARCVDSIIPTSKTKISLLKYTDEKGCVKPLYGEKAKCVLHIVPQNKKCETMKIDPKCIKKSFVFN